MPTRQEIAKQLDSIVSEMEKDAIALGSAQQAAGLEATVPGATQVLKADADERTASAEDLKRVRSLYANDAQAFVSKRHKRTQTALARFAWPAVPLVLSMWVALWWAGRWGLPSPVFPDFQDQATVLAFLVALAAYLQTVASGLKAALAHPKKSSEDKKHWEDFCGVVMAETAIVLVAVAATVRMLLSPFAEGGRFYGWLSEFQVDFAILVGFSLCILFLALLHARQWKARNPEV